MEVNYWDKNIPDFSGIKIELPEESLEPDPLTAGHLEIQVYEI